MARAKRHYVPGHIWHITHRCHKREFLLKFAKDRQRWIHWLLKAKRRYGLAILNYAITSNHVHLLVVDDGPRNTIPNSIKLVAGRTGQEYNQRKNRKGAFWEDRYHATAVENGEHLLRCLAYIDLNMVRTGVVKHPSEWLHCGYNEIQKPRRKNILINYKRLQELLGFKDYDQFKTEYVKRIENYLKTACSARDDKWTQSIAVGSEAFIEKVRSAMGGSAIGRKVIEASGSYQLRESQALYKDLFEAEKCEIEYKNDYIWN